MANVVTDIISSVATLYYSALATALPADTLAVGGAWPSGWLPVGYTKEPIKANYEYDVLDVMIQESLAPVRRRKTKENLTIETVLAELSPTLMNLQMEGVVSTQASGPGKEEITVGQTPVLTERQWGFEINYIDEDGANFPFRWFIWKATGSAGGEFEHGREDYIGTPLTLAAVADMTKAAGARLAKVQKITEP